MNRDTQQFINELESVKPEAASLYEFVERFDTLDINEISDTIFLYLEKNSSEDLGSPGPLVHLLEEGYPNYIEKLKESISRKPTDLTIWMLNRILNAKIEKELRIELMGLMEQASKHPLADQDAKSEALNFLKFQNEE